MYDWALQGPCKHTKHTEHEIVCVVTMACTICHCSREKAVPGSLRDRKVPSWESRWYSGGLFPLQWTPLLKGNCLSLNCTIYSGLHFCSTPRIRRALCLRSGGQKRLCTMILRAISSLGKRIGDASIGTCHYLSLVQARQIAPIQGISMEKQRVTYLGTRK